MILKTDQLTILVYHYQERRRRSLIRHVATRESRWHVRLASLSREKDGRRNDLGVVVAAYRRAVLYHHQMLSFKEMQRKPILLITRHVHGRVCRKILCYKGPRNACIITNSKQRG
jgi:hypothetical protein